MVQGVARCSDDNGQSLNIRVTPKVSQATCNRFTFICADPHVDRFRRASRMRRPGFLDCPSCTLNQTVPLSGPERLGSSRCSEWSTTRWERSSTAKSAASAGVKRGSRYARRSQAPQRVSRRICKFWHFRVENCKTCIPLYKASGQTAEPKRTVFAEITGQNRPKKRHFLRTREYRSCRFY